MQNLNLMKKKLGIGCHKAEKSDINHMAPTVGTGNNVC